MITAMARAKPPPASRAMKRPSVSETPVSCSAAHEHGRDHDGGLAAEARERFVGLEQARERQGQHDQHRDDVVAQPLGEQEHECHAQDDEKKSWGVSRPVTFCVPARGVPGSCLTLRRGAA
jgi:hypothetical protein